MTKKITEIACPHCGVKLVDAGITEYRKEWSNDFFHWDGERFVTDKSEICDGDHIDFYCYSCEKKLPKEWYCKITGNI